MTGVKAIRYRERKQNVRKNNGRCCSLTEKPSFSKKLIGGVDEADVWRQLDMLQRNIAPLTRRRKNVCVR